MSAPKDRAEVASIIAVELQRIYGKDPQYDDGADADAILVALEAAGVRLVPVEATAVQYDAASEHLVPAMDAMACYGAMLDASPYAPPAADT